MRKTYLDDSSDDDSEDDPKPSKYKIIVIGDYKVGKSSLISRIARNEFSLLYASTKCMEIFTDVKMGDIVVDIWDVPPHTCKFYNVISLRSDAVIIMFDSDAQSTLQEGLEIFKLLHKKLYNDKTPELWIVYRGTKKVKHIDECHPDRVFHVNSLTNDGFLDLIYDIRCKLLRRI